MEAKKVFHDVFQNIEVGIGEVSKTVGVSQRQLRYWEEKGYIKPVDDNQSGVRRYTLSTLYLIIFIKTQLDQGFTLSAAFERSKDIKVKSKIVRNFFKHTFNEWASNPLTGRRTLRWTCPTFTAPSIPAPAPGMPSPTP